VYSKLACSSNFAGFVSSGSIHFGMEHKVLEPVADHIFFPFVTNDGQSCNITEME